MPRPEITAIRFRPAAAIARLGNSFSPLEAFTWAEDPRIFGAGKTVIVPQVSFEVLADGRLEPYVPDSIRFKDGDAVRPVCPFLEFTAVVNRGRDRGVDEPLTGSLLRECGISPAQLSFQVTAANRKAQRRTGDASCGFEARLFVEGNNHARQPLLAWTRPESPDALVKREHPIPLGFFQVLKPEVRPLALRGVCLDHLRVRFTPAAGQVYGPPTVEVSRTTDSRSDHVIVPPENRILNPNSTWVRYDSQTSSHPPPRPSDTYDGESDLNRDNVSWGVVDDTCDVVIVAKLATAKVKLIALARIFVGPPDYAPDRRPFYSIADDLADRDPEALRKKPSEVSPREWHDAVTDLFRRISETASMFNLERYRRRQLDLNPGFQNPHGFPEIGEQSMTAADQIAGQPLLSEAGKLAAELAGQGADDGPALPLSERARIRHDELADAEELLQFLLTDPDRFRQILRPPFERAARLPAKVKDPDPLDLRDPRFDRQYAFDARMPPYMRDGDFAALSLTRLQWDLLFPKGTEKKSAEAARAFTEAAFEQAGVNRHVRKLKAPKTRRRPTKP